jgi:transposase-like protein
LVLVELLGGIKLWVREEDAGAAAELLDQNVPEEFDVSGVGEYIQSRCPSCQSFDVSFEELNRRVAFITAWLGFPVPLKHTGWRCHSCGHQWEEADASPS